MYLKNFKKNIRLSSRNEKFLCIFEAEQATFVSFGILHEGSILKSMMWNGGVV